MCWYNFHYRKINNVEPIEQTIIVNKSYSTVYLKPNYIKTKYLSVVDNNVKYIKPNEIKTKYVPLSNNKVRYVKPNVIKVKIKC